MFPGRKVTAPDRLRSSRIADLATAAGCTLRGEDSRVTGIAYDSRKVERGDLFVALRGGYADGHAFVPEAIRRGAAAVLVEHDSAATVPELVCANSRAALAPIAASFYGQPSTALSVVGVTGTDGKTTTTYLLDTLLQANAIATGLVGTVSVKIANRVVEHETRQTTPESVDVQRYLADMVAAGVQVAILEATSHGLDLHRLDCIRFAIGAVTNVTHEHLEHHKTIDAYRSAKGILFERVAAADGGVVINLDDEGARSMADFARGVKCLTYSTLDPTANLFASEIALDVRGSRFRLRFSQCDYDVWLPLPGLFNVENALCSLGIASLCGVGMDQAVDALASAPAPPGRLAPVDRGQPFSVFVDYAHTPGSLEKVLGLLRQLNPGGKLIVVTGSAGERDTAKRPLQGEVCARLADFTLFTSEDPRFERPEAIIDQIAEGAVAAGATEGDTFLRVTDRTEAIEIALGRAVQGDCVLLAGKGHEGSMIWGSDKREWNEADVAGLALDRLKGSRSW